MWLIHVINGFSGLGSHVCYKSAIVCRVWKPPWGRGGHIASSLPVSLTEKRNVIANKLLFFQWHVIVKIIVKTWRDLTILGSEVLSWHRITLSAWKSQLIVWYKKFCSGNTTIMFNRDLRERQPQEMYSPALLSTYPAPVDAFIDCYSMRRVCKNLLVMLLTSLAGRHRFSMPAGLENSNLPVSLVKVKRNRSP